MHHELNTSDLSPILEYLNDFHEGDLLSFSEWLNQAIYMLHYLPSDTFLEFERQNCCHVLIELKEAVMEIYINNKKDN